MKRKVTLAVICMAAVCCMQAQISAAMQEKIKRTEGLMLEVYRDGDKLAVGYGHHIRYSHQEWIQDLEEGDPITEELAGLLFRHDMLYLVTPGLEQIKRELGREYPQNVYDVLGSLIYNMGLQGMKSTEFYRLFKAGEYERAFSYLLLAGTGQKGNEKRRRMELEHLLEGYEPRSRTWIKEEARYQSK